MRDTIAGVLAFHNDHPEVYHLFERFTREAIAAGHQHLSATMINHRIRWETTIRGGSPYKVLNATAAYYARLFEQENPEHSGFFRMKGSAMNALFLPKAA